MAKKKKSIARDTKPLHVLLLKDYARDQINWWKELCKLGFHRDGEGAGISSTN